MRVKSVMSIIEQVMMSPDQRSSLCQSTRLLIYQQQTLGLPYVHTRHTHTYAQTHLTVQITTPAPHHSVFTRRMPFLPPNQQRQSTEDFTNL